MKSIVYQLTDLESGQCAEGTAVALSALTGIRKSMFRCLAKENRLYQERYFVKKLPCGKQNEEGSEGLVRQKPQGEGIYQPKSLPLRLLEEWDAMHQIYLELREGEREIRRATDGKRYAVKV